MCVKPLHSRLEAIQRVKAPTTAKQCKSFAGMVNFVSIFCPELQRLLKPIYDLTRKGKQFVWGKEQQEAFEEIKRRLQKSPVLQDICMLLMLLLCVSIPRLTHIEEALTTCKYPSWAIQRVKLKKNIQKQTKEKKRNNSNINNRSSITVPYNQGLSESFKNIGKKYGIQVHFKSGRTIKDELVAPKDKDHITKKSGIIYRFKCDRLECDEEYIGETSRTFGERFREHLKAPSPIHDHSNTSGHTTTLDNFKVVGREEQNLSRLIKESMYIRVNGPSLNKNIGKYHLPHIWDEVLNNSRELKLK